MPRLLRVILVGSGFANVGTTPVSRTKPYDAMGQYRS